MFQSLFHLMELRVDTAGYYQTHVIVSNYHIFLLLFDVIAQTLYM